MVWEAVPGEDWYLQREPIGYDSIGGGEEME